MSNSNDQDRVTLDDLVGYLEIFTAESGMKFPAFPTGATIYGSYRWKIVDAVQTIMLQTILPHPPPIVSANPPQSNSEGWPTDYLGMYFPGDEKNTGYNSDHHRGRRIEIYEERINACWKYFSRKSPDRKCPETSQMLAWSEEDLRIVVIVHELMHAQLHTGCFECEEGGASPTELRNFLSERLKTWRSIRGTGNKVSPVLELHAQLGTWQLLRRGKSMPRSGPARAFLDLMAEQPAEYVIPNDLLKTPRYYLLVWTWLARDQVSFSGQRGLCGQKRMRQRYRMEKCLREGNLDAYPGAMSAN